VTRGFKVRKEIRGFRVWPELPDRVDFRDRLDPMVSMDSKGQQERPVHLVSKKGKCS
jgi:hypothetical protein